MLYRTRHLWAPLTVATPLALAGLALLGYGLTARRLTLQLFDTAWFVLAVVVVHNLVIRWLLLARKKLAVQRAREKREAERAEHEAEESISTDEGGLASVDIPEVNLAEIGAQSRHLLQVFTGWSVMIGIWLIWADVLPALGFLEKISLWHQTVIVDGAETLQPVTLLNLLLALVFAALATAAARNIPGVLEIAFLERLSIEPGSRYAITTLTQYTIVAAGTMLVFNAIGGSWSQIQWLVAALGVGLGFGLQEIFANFISGLIILFERPVRLGDTVTVGDLTGVVQRVRIRATTILDWDRKEILVPNKALITERVINWTLKDPITRLVIPIGVAYGSDTALVHKIILDTVRSLPLVLEDPEPQLFFVGFGESSLDFSVRAFVQQLGDRLPVTHELHMAVERALRQNEIVIPFPQRDIHVRPEPKSPNQEVEVETQDR
jgi:potassium efflux system protein